MSTYFVPKIQEKQNTLYPNCVKKNTLKKYHTPVLKAMQISYTQNQQGGKLTVHV